MNRYILALLSLVFTSAVALAQKQKIEFHEFNLDNGLHVILHEDHSTPNVAVTVLYHVGSKNEDTARTGFAHFFEHLLFEGSENIARGEYDDYVERAGGQLNANTSKDRTFYFEILPSNYLEMGLWLESERMLHAKVDEVGVETQREVVKEEKRQRVDNRPYGDWIQQAFSRAYKIHPYKWEPIGSMAHLNAATEQDYKDFYKTYYVPNNATLSIAGDIDIEETKKLVKKYFSEIPKGNKIPRPEVVEPELEEEIRGTVYDNVQLPAVIHGYRIPEQTHEDAYAIQMLSMLLSQGESSRITKNLVNEKQLALQGYNFAYLMEDPGMLFSFIICNAGKDPEVVEAALDAEYEKLKENLITERELQKLQNMIENQFLSRFSSISTRAELLANYHVYHGNANLINNEIEEYMEVTREDIKRVANKYLRDDNRVALYYLPKKSQ